MDNDFNNKDVLDTVASAAPPQQPGATMPKLTNEVGDAMPNLNPTTPQGQPPIPNTVDTPTPYVPVGHPNTVVNAPTHHWKKIASIVFFTALLFAAIGLLIGYFWRDSDSNNSNQNTNIVQQEPQQTPVEVNNSEEDQLEESEQEPEPEETETEEDNSVEEPEEKVELEVLILGDKTQVTYDRTEFSEAIDIDRMPQITGEELYNYGIQSRVVTNHLKDFEAVQTCNTPGGFGYFDFFIAEERISDTGLPNTYSSVVEINELAEDPDSLLRKLDDDLYVRYIGASPPCFIELITHKDNKTNEDDIVKLVPGLERDPVEDAKEVLKTFAVVE